MISKASALALYPGALVVVTLRSIKFLGDGLQDALIPFEGIKSLKTAWIVHR